MASTMKIVQCIFAFWCILPGCIDRGQVDAISDCGVAPNINRTLKCESIIPPPIPGLHLAQVRNEKGFTAITIGVHGSETVRYYASLDRGLSWSRIGEINESIMITNTATRREALGGYAKNVNAPTIYQFDPVSHCVSAVSMDSGKSWKKIEPKAGNGSITGQCQPIGVYGNQGERIYIWAYDVNNRGLWVSNDYGRTFSFLTSKVSHVIESPGDSRIMYGIADNHLEKSLSGGTDWTDLPSSRSIFAPVFIGVDGIYRTWDSDGRGSKDGYPYAIEQLQIDPLNADALYILTSKGLFRSLDGGVTFVLLPLGIDRLSWINKIAIDPIDGRYIYAQCGMNSLYRSNDRGCSWVKINVPLE